jgi:hypothetical protein
MTVGLLAKTALFQLHIWLPPAHAGAPGAASAVLSALVVKGSWFLVVRLWLDVMPGVVTLSAAQLRGKRARTLPIDGIAGWPGLGPSHGQGRLQLAC